jgi:hypothetical protein
MTQDQAKIRKLEEEIADLKRRWPPHSVPVRMWQQLEALEEALERARAGEGDGKEVGTGRL